MHGRLSVTDGEILFDPDRPDKAAVTARLDPASISTGVPELDEKLRDDLGPAPILFEGTGAVATGPADGTLAGTLTLNGHQAPVTLAIHFNGARQHPFNREGMVGFSATASLDRRDFGVDAWQGFVGNDVTVVLEVEALHRAGIKFKQSSKATEDKDPSP